MPVGEKLALLQNAEDNLNAIDYDGRVSFSAENTTLIERENMAIKIVLLVLELAIAIIHLIQ